MAVYKRGRTWWLDVYDGPTRIRKSLGVRDKVAALQIAAEHERHRELRKAGIETYFDSGRAEPLELVEEYLRVLEARGTTPTHRKVVDTQLRRILSGARSLRDVQPRWIREQQDRLAAEHRLSGTTLNKYRTSLGAFFGWLIREGRWGSNPCKAVPRRAETPVRPDRRALSPSEQRRLCESAPAHRALVYLVATTTGLRRSELRRLRRGHVDFEANLIRLPGSKTKNRKPALLPISAQVREDWMRWLEQAGHTAPDAPAVPPVPSVPTLRRDLTRAGIEAGHAMRLDFHGLRVTFITNLARAGVPLAQAQKLARHSDPALTARIYMKFTLDEQRGAIDKLDQLFETAA